MEKIYWIVDLANNFEILLYFLVFFFAAGESTIGASTMMPGSLTVMLIGASAAVSSLNIYLILLLAFTGAVIGDNISYLLGSRYGSVLAKKLRIKDSVMQDAKEFIDRHGPKSVALGRFVPFVKETIPFIAGTLHMRHKTFMLYNIIGAFGWMIMWPLSGYLFAKAVLVGNDAFTKAQLAVALLIFSYLFYFFFRDFLSKYISFDANRYFKLIRSRRVLFFSSVIFILYSSFLLLAFAVIERKNIIAVMDYLGLSWFFKDNHLLFVFFKYFTYGADWHFVLPVSLIVSALFFKKHFVAVVSWWLAFLGTAFSVLLLKLVVARPRPEYMKIAEDGLAFPSGHAAIASVVAFYFVFLVFVFVKSKYKYVLAILALLWALAIYISRLYLGVHYLSDIIGGMIIGAVFAVLGIASYMHLEQKSKLASLSKINHEK